MDRAAQLVLGDLGVLHGRDLTEPGHRDAELVGDQSAQPDSEPLPQVGDAVLPDHVRGVVVAVRAQRLSQRRVVLAVPRSAAVGSAVRAEPQLPRAGVTGSAVVTAAVDASERRCGQGGEDQRVVGHRDWDGLPADHARADQLEHVRGVQPGARGALRGAAVAAPDPGHPQRLTGAGVLADDLTARDVDRLAGPDQSDRLGAVSNPGQRLGPAVEVWRPDEVGQLPLRPRIRGPRALARVCRLRPGVAEHGR
jgi:hypothetical protein